MIGLQHIQITPDLLSTLCAIDEFKGGWAALDDHTMALNLIGDVAEHGAQFKTVLEPLRHHDLSLDIIKALHMSVSVDADRGVVREADYALPFLYRGDEVGVIETAAPDDIAPLLQKLLEWVNVDIMDEKRHPVLTVGVFVAVFLQISPFASGNLKLARLLGVLLLLKRDYRYVGFVSLDPLMEDYALALHMSLLSNQQSLEAGRPNWQAWLLCFSGILLRQTQILQDKIDGADAADDFADMPQLSLRLLECVKANKRTTMKEMIAFTRGRRATIKLRLQELLERGMIKRHGAGRGVWYSLI